MNYGSSIYNDSYFETEHFQMDYGAIAQTVVDIYKPKTVADFGCGPGHLSRELAKRGVQVTAVDGFTKPDFRGLPVQFFPCNLDDAEAIASIFAGQTFDVAICLEVAEHLQPKSSQHLLNWLTQIAPVVVFSAAVLGQPGGDGHINLRPRDFWHRGFVERDFVVSDRIREKLRDNPNIAIWYRLNVLDYVQQEHPLVSAPNEVIARLIASESASTTAYFEEYCRLTYAEELLGSKVVRLALKFREIKNALLTIFKFSSNKK